MGDLHDKCPHGLGHLNAWFPVGGAVIWVGLGGVALLEEMCLWGQALRFQTLSPLTVCTLDFMAVIQE